jgi:hypothetical protein
VRTDDAGFILTGPDLLEDGHRPAWASPERNVVANREVLKLRENAPGARTIEVAEEAIEPVVAVQPAAALPQLHCQGQTCSVGRWMVTALVQTLPGRASSRSPGQVAWCSWSVAPH